jgi:hypothetical protein
MKKVLSLLPALLLAGMIFYACQEQNVTEPVNKTGTLLLTVACDGPSNLGITPIHRSENTPEVTPQNIKIDPPNPGTYALGPGFVTFTKINTECGEIINWSVTGPIQIDYVYMKGGPDYNEYNYTGMNPRPTSDGNLYCPDNSSGNYPNVSHLNFVWSYRLTISKTANAQFTRTYDWTIEKNADHTELVLSEGQIHTVYYSVVVDADYTDSDWKVCGTITIQNNSPYTATITSITDMLTGGIAVTLDCPVILPYELAAGATLQCTYSQSVPSAASGTNTVTVATTGVVGGGSAEANYTFGSPTTEIDECISVDDNLVGALGTVCYNETPKTFNYSMDISYPVCGSYRYTNTASFTSNDRSLFDSDGHEVIVEVPCYGGCTLTPGYWKTHSQLGPAPYDNTWLLLDAVLQEGKIFFFSGQTYHQVLWASPAGNIYYILAHSYIAAQLNLLNGASVPTDVQNALNWANSFFNNPINTPEHVATLKGSARNNVIMNATILDNYNNGLIGPGHCSE